MEKKGSVQNPDSSKLRLLENPEVVDG